MRSIRACARAASGIAIVLAAFAEPAEAQLVGATLPNMHRWEAAAHVALAPAAEEIFRGGWAFSGGRRLTDRLAITAEAGRQRGYALCDGTRCPPGDYETFSSSFFAAGPRFQITQKMFTQLVVGAIAPEILPTRHLILRPGVGWDFGNQIAAFRLEVNVDVVPNLDRMFNVWGRAGLVIRIGAR